MARGPWWPGPLAAQAALMRNFLSKIDLYGEVLGLTPAEIAAAKALCTSFIGAFNAAEQAKMTMHAMTKWRNIVLYNERLGMPAPPPPVFAVPDTAGVQIGVINSFYSLRDRLISSPGFTNAIGEDLGILGPQQHRRLPHEITPDLKPAISGSKLEIRGSMQKMDALRIEYAAAGGDFQTIGYLTHTPGTLHINTAIPDQPEKGHVRAVFIKKSKEYGNFSPSYPVIVS